MNIKKVFHIDVNSAYLSWEAAYQLQKGASLDLRIVPSAIGGDVEKRRGIILAKSIPASKKGVLTGQPLAKALIKCPEMIIVAPDYQRYVKASDSLVGLVKNYSPYIQRFSVDELFMDYVGHEDPVDVAYRLKEDVENTLGFTVNIGVGDNKLLAKMASDFKKPNMVHKLYKKDIPCKMWPLPVRSLFMVGSRTEAKLKSRDIYTIGDLARLSEEYIYRWMKKPGQTIWNFANGREYSGVRTFSSPIKSIGNSTTIPYDVYTQEEALQIILAICEMVGYRLRGEAMVASVVHLGYRSHDFQGFGMERKLKTLSSCTEDIYQMAKKIFKKIWNREGIRQLSVRVTNLSPASKVQLSLFAPINEERIRLNSSIDQIRNQHGLRSIQRSTFLHSGIPPLIGGVMEDLDYPMMTSQL